MSYVICLYAPYGLLSCARLTSALAILLASASQGAVACLTEKTASSGFFALRSINDPSHLQWRIRPFDHPTRVVREAFRANDPAKRIVEINTYDGPGRIILSERVVAGAISTYQGPPTLKQVLAPEIGSAVSYVRTIETQRNGISGPMERQQISEKVLRKVPIDVHGCTYDTIEIETSSQTTHVGTTAVSNFPPMTTLTYFSPLLRIDLKVQFTSVRWEIIDLQASPIAP